MNVHPTLVEEMNRLKSAEEIMDFFAIPFDEEVVEVNRLHILQRFHDYIERHADETPASAKEQHPWLRQWLVKAYEDFVASDAQTEKVFRVFRDTPAANGGTSTFVPVEEMFQ